ncbi:hypothetical protein B9Z65_6287 [Elsinoe australis]|uniref:LysM domain-containing protein n=1 Tax=Elsinoe australis TaxID=40998 RepID=A0A2P8A874_9PEZI|nr:hypothetical protein B9Z65_6287 [Elsinoe australis]
MDGLIVLSLPQGQSLTPTASSDAPIVTRPVTAAPVPTNARDGSNRQCGAWYTVRGGDTCSLITLAESISLTNLYFLNPSIDGNCTNLLLDIAYCVQAVGTITTYSGYPTTSQWITLPPRSTRISATATKTVYSGIVPTKSQMPIVSGTKEDCAIYRNYDSQDPAKFRSGVDINGCPYVAYSYGISVNDLLQWNPGLSAENCALQAGFSYCVRASAGHVPSADSASLCDQTTAIMLGTDSTCVCLAKIYSYFNLTYTCAMLAEDYRITSQDLTRWNPWVGTDCDKGLFADLSYYDERAVCIGVNSTVPSATASTPPTTATTSTVVFADLPGPTRADMAKDFGSNCENLWLGYSYCVLGPATAITGSGGSPAPPAPTQNGLASSCTKFYVVEAGDSCWKIQTTYEITATQLQSWNPAVGADCLNLWVGYAVCVAA